MIQIKRNNEVFYTIDDVCEGSKLSRQLMDHHYVILKFSTEKPVYFEIGDSVEIPDFGYFELTSAYFPKYNDSTDGYDYELQMDAYYMAWKNKICKYRPQYGANETSFKLTTSVAVHLNVILSNLKALGYKYNGLDFAVDYTTYHKGAFDIDKRFYIEYGSISILDALNAICDENALDCEWWVDGNIIYLGYCEMTGQVTFEQGVNMLSMSYSESKSSYITRLYAFGSDKNIPKGYFTGSDADVTTDGIATDYLMLPNNEVDSDGFYSKDGYLENTNVVKNEKQAIEGVVMFDDEYPKVECTVSGIKTYDSTVEEDGEKKTQTFWQVTSKDSFATNFTKSWKKRNLTLMIKFTSGALMGMEFDVEYKIIEQVNYFEIVANDTYGRSLPDGVMCPKKGDTFFLYNWDSTKITETNLIQEAQNALYERAKTYYLKSMIDNSNFTCVLDAVKFYNRGVYNYHPLGEQVKLINPMFSDVDANGKHYRNSRIIGMDINLDIPYDAPTYIVGEQAASSRLSKLEDKVTSITVNGIQIGGTGSGGGGVYVIGLNDSTPATDSNVYSARRVDQNYTNKYREENIREIYTFAKGLISEMLVQLKGGATFGTGGYKFDEKGNVVVDALSSLAFDEALERGFGIKKNSQGKYTLSVTDLMVWGKAVFNSLEIRKLYAVGGNVYLSGASSRIQHVAAVTDTDGNVTGWKCYILNDDGTTATQNGWRKYDQAKCQTFDIKEGVYENVSNTYYWRLVTDVSTENETITETYTDADGKEQTRDLYDGKKFGWVVLSKTDCESTTNDAPKAGDTIVLDGHRMFASGDADGRDQYNDESRTNVMMLETTGTENGTLPRIVALTGIVDYRHWDGVNQYSNTVFILSPKEVVFVSSSFKFMSASGDPITLVNFRGNWAERTEYRYYDQVSHNDSIWTCIVEKGKATTAEPSDTSKDWRKEISGGKGDPAVTYELVASPSYIKLDADGSFDRSNQYREGQMLLVRGYKIVGGKRITQWGDADNPISIQISFNDGAAWYESTFNNGESGLDEVYNDFEPTCEDSYFSMLQEMKKNGLKNCKAVMYEGESLDPDKIPSDKVLARIDIPIVQDGKDGASGTSYGVTLTVEKRRTISSVEDDCLVVTFTKGDTDGVTTTNNVQDIGGYAQLYVDGKIDTSATARLNLGTSEAGELQKGAFPQVFTAGYVTVKWYDKEGGTLLGTGSLTRGADGKDATVYGVQVSSYSEWISSGNKQQGLQFGFTKTTGTTVEKYTNVTKMGCTVKIYGDDTLYDNVSGWINEGNDNFLFSSFPYNNVVGNPTLADKSVISVELYHDYVLLATANYANGKQGADGIGALEISVAPDTLVFDTNDDGIVPIGTSKEATIACYRDGKKVTNVEYALTEGGHPDCDASISTSNNTATVTISNIARDETYDVSKTSGTVEVQVYDEDNGRYYFPTVKFAVNVAKFNGGLKADNKTLKSQYSKLSNNGSITDLKEYKSEILQSAREISLKVSEKSVGRRNMLVGSACRKYGNGFAYMSGSETQYYDGYPLEQIEINSGIDGVNCIHCRTKRTGTDSYHSSGFSWNGISPQGNIKLEKGKNYVLSFYAKTPTPNDIYFIAEVLYQGSKIDTSRPAKYDGPTGYSTTFSVSEANKWELFTVKLSVPSNAKYEYEEINIFARSKVYSFVDGYICKPMLEEGEEYNGWTLSEQDYDYVGGNLLDGTGTLTKTGNVEVLDETTVKQDGYNNESASVKAILLPTMEIGNYLQYSTKDMGLKVGEDCMLSFYARAASGYAPGGLQCYLYSPSTGIVLTESSHEKLDFLWNPADGKLHTHITPTTAWKRYWVHWRPMGNVPQYILFRLVRPGTNKESYDSSTSYNVGDVVLYGGTYYVCQKAGIGYAPGASSHWEATEFAIEIARPKLEVGATMTEWTAKRADMVDKQALYATGIDIDSKKITLTASNTTFRGNDGKELAVIDQDGLRATKIATTDNGGGHTEISGNSTVWYNKDGVTPGIKVFYDAAGVPHFQFCNSNGKVMYDFGPSGLQSFISSTQQAYSDECYLRSASSSVSTSGTKLSFDWLYVARNQSADKRFVWRKQIPTTEASSLYEIYDGCVFTKEYYNTANSVNWPKPAYLLPDGWYVEPNDGNLPMKIRPADDEGVFDPTQTVYYQTFYYYEGGKVARTVRAYMKRTTSSQLVSKFTYAGSYDEI